MNESWYEVVAPGTALTQGDLVFDCPLLTWSARRFSETPAAPDPEILKEGITAFTADVVVMTQACDLEHGKVRNVVLCPHDPLSLFRKTWEEGMKASGHNPTEKAWRKTCDDVANGYVWNHCFLNSFDGSVPRLELRIVDFNEIFTLPREFLEGFLSRLNTPRLRLLPPYREHLSQAFARFFMRVGLPQSLAKTW
jgi:hypothetical protein